MNPDSPWLRGGVVLAGLFVIQEALLRGLRIDGIRPDLLLGFGIVAALTAGPERGAVLAFAGGFLTDLFVDTPFGLTALVACVVAFLAGSIQQSLGANQRWSVPLLTGLASLVAELVWGLVGTVLGLPGLLHPRLVAIALVVATVNVAISLPIARVARWIVAGVADAKPGAASRGFAA